MTQINLKRVDSEETQKLLAFFERQAKLGVKLWKKGEAYTFGDGSSFSFKHDVFVRLSKKQGLRYEVISNKAKLGEGSFGSVHKIKGTIALQTNKLRFKQEGRKGTKRVVKIQRHNNNNELKNLQNEYELTKRVDHLAVKEPTIVQDIRSNDTSYTVMREIKGRELFDILNDDYAGKRVL